MAGPTAACLELSRRLARDYNDYAYATKAPGVPVYIDIPEPQGLLRWSPTRIQVSLASMLHCRTRQGSDLQAFHVDSGTILMGFVDSDTNWSWANWIRPPCSWAGLSSILSTATGPPGWLYASATSMGHPGLPESRHYCWIPGNHTHNSLDPIHKEEGCVTCRLVRGSFETSQYRG